MAKRARAKTKTVRPPGAARRAAGSGSRKKAKPDPTRAGKAPAGAAGSKTKKAKKAGPAAKGRTAKKSTGKPAGRSKSTASRSRRGVSESAAARKRRARRILDRLHRLYEEADCALIHDNAFQLLVATILSAQSTDENVNKVTPRLFARFPSATELAEAEPEEVEEIIRSTGFFRQKAKNILGAARTLVEEFGGEVPQSLAELIRLPGVARKTANVVLGTWFGLNEGVVVDTHVGRLSERLGLTWNARNSKDAVRIEKDLQEVVPREDWTFFSHALIWHGRGVCRARTPLCQECDLAPDCPAALDPD